MNRPGRGSQQRLRQEGIGPPQPVDSFESRQPEGIPDPVTLHVMVGLPYSGKTTWAHGRNCPVVCPDAVRLALHGMRFVPAAERMVWAMARYMVNALFHAGHRWVVLDACNHTESRRDDWISGPGDVWETTSYHIVTTPPETCLARALEVDDQDILPVIKRMAETWDHPRKWKEEAHAGPG